MESSMERETKLEKLLDIIEKMMYILDRRLDSYEVNTNDDYLEQPMLIYKQEQTQDLDNEQDMYYDVQESIEMKSRVIRNCLIACLYLAL